MAERKSTDAAEAPERKIYKYLGPADQLAVGRPLDELGQQLYDYYRPGQDVALDDTQFRWLSQRGHHFEGHGTAVAGTPIPGIAEQAYLESAAVPPPIARAQVVETQTGEEQLVGASPVQVNTQPPSEESSTPFAVGTSEAPSAIVETQDQEEPPRRGRKSD